MTTCALVSAANVPARPSPANGASLRTLRSFSEGGRNTDITLDAPVSNVLTTCFGRRPAESAASGEQGRGVPAVRSGKLYRQAGRHLTFFPLTFSVGVGWVPALLAFDFLRPYGAQKLGEAKLWSPPEP